MFLYRGNITVKIQDQTQETIHANVKIEVRVVYLGQVKMQTEPTASTVCSNLVRVWDIVLQDFGDFEHASHVLCILKRPLGLCEEQTIEKEALERED